MPAPRPDPFQLSLQPGPDDDNTTPTTIRRDRPSLLDQLSIIDTEGWHGPAGTRLLQYLRTELVRPLTIHLGLRGAAASQAEATAWEAVWVEATNPSLRAADSPWGVLWRTARRAVLNEVVATRFASSLRHGWILAAAARRWEPKRLRLRLFTIPAPLARTGRRLRLHLSARAVGRPHRRSLPIDRGT